MIKAHQISNWVFILLFAVSLIIFGIFYCVGYDNPQGDYNAPENTDLLIKFMYFMTALCTILAIVAVIMSAVSSMGGPKGVNMTGVPDKAISIVSLLIFVGSLVISYAMASDVPVMTGNGLFDDAFLLKITDMFIYANYALMAIASVLLIINLTGVFKK